MLGKKIVKDKDSFNKKSVTDPKVFEMLLRKYRPDLTIQEIMQFKKDNEDGVGLDVLDGLGIIDKIERK
jgi:hypothetical protein